MAAADLLADSEFSSSFLIIRATAATRSLSLLSVAAVARLSGLAGWTRLASRRYLGRPRVRSSPGPEIVLLLASDDGELSLDGSVGAGGRLGCRRSTLRSDLI